MMKTTDGSREKKKYADHYVKEITEFIRNFHCLLVPKSYDLFNTHLAKYL